MSKAFEMAVIAQLEAENARLREELAACIDLRNRDQDSIESLMKQLSAAEKVREGLIQMYGGMVKDAARYRWLRDTQEGKTIRIMPRNEWDESIDEAIEQEQCE